MAAATTVFTRRGIHGASIEQIAEEAGYSTGAVYHHFAGKDDLLLAVFEAYAATRAQEFAAISAEASGELPRQTRVVADHWMARLQREPDLLVLFLELVVHAWRNPHLRQPLALRNAAGRLALARLLDQRADALKVELPMPTEELATVLRELGTGLGVAKLIDPDGIDDELFGDFVERFFERATGAAGAARPTAERGPGPSDAPSADG